MMNKWLKRTLIVSAAVTAAGAVLLGAGIALGGSPSFYYDADGFHVKENTEETVRSDYVLEKTQTGALTRLELDLQDSDLQIVSGNEWSVEYVPDGWYSEPVYSVENGTLTLQEGSYVDTEYGELLTGTLNGDDVNVYGDYGSIQIGALKVDTVGIETEYGNVNADVEAAQSLEVESSDGEVSLDLSGKLEDYGDIRIREK